MKIALVGAGAIARRGHIPGLKKSSFSVAALLEQDEATLQRVADEFSIERRYSSLERLLQDDDIQAISVCTPTHTHFHIVETCLAAGKHVIVEKPLAFDYIESKQLTELARQSGTTSAVIQNWRYFPKVIESKSRIAAGKIGAIHSGHAFGIARFPNGWTRNKWLYHKRGVLYDFAPHAVDMVIFLLGEVPQKVFAEVKDFTGQMGFANYAKVFLKFKNGSQFTFDFSWLTGSLVFQVFMHGTAGHIFLDVRNNTLFEYHGSLTPVDLLRHYSSASIQLTKDILNSSYVLGPMSHYNTIYDNFFASINGSAKPHVSFEMGFETNLVLDAAFLSSHLKQEIDIDELRSGAYDREFRKLAR